MRKPVSNSIAPWLSIRNSAKAVEFYTSAFGATETYRLDVPDGVIVRLSVNGAEFWVGEESSERGDAENLGGDSVRLILITPDPDALFVRALAAGAKEIFPVGEDHGWRLGRIVDPYGLHWEIGYQLED